MLDYSLLHKLFTIIFIIFFYLKLKHCQLVRSVVVLQVSPRQNKPSWWRCSKRLSARRRKVRCCQDAVEPRRCVERSVLCPLVWTELVSFRLSVTLQVISAREKRALLDDCAKLTEHLVLVLPKLLSKVLLFNTRGPFKSNAPCVWHFDHFSAKFSVVDSIVLT